MCESGLRFSAHAGGGLANACLAGETDTADGSTSDPTLPATSEVDSDTQATTTPGSTTATPCGPCDSPPSGCYEAAGNCDPDTGTCVYAPASLGAPCGDGDACSGALSCDGFGVCEGSDVVACDDPPSDCYEATGECDPDTGTCDYALRVAGSDCEDGNACTVDDTCSVDGTCVPGEVCPAPVGEPCTAGTCDAGVCTYDTLADGTSCGATESLRCCGGSCVDISSDEENCGACGLACDGDLECESIAATSTCPSAPENVSGRCRCTGFNAQCPGGQICRTVTPFADRCTPSEPSDCPGTSNVVVLNLCPDYCEY